MGLGTHGKNTKMIGFGYDLSEFLRNVNTKGSVNTADSSAFGSAYHEYQGTTQAPATMACQGLYSDSTNEIQARVEAMLAASGIGLHFPEGYNAAGKCVAAVQGTTVKHGGSAPRDGMVDIAFDILSQVGLDLGRSLNSFATAVTAAGNGTAVDFDRATASGGAAYLVCEAFTGTSCTVTIEDSADGSNDWQTIGTFAAASAAHTEQRITISGAIRRYVRCVYTGTFTSFKSAIVFSKYAD